MKIPNPKNRRQQGWVLIVIGVILVVGMAGVLSVGLYSCAKRHMPESVANPTGLPTNTYIWHQVITNTVSTNGTPTNPPSPRALSLPVVARGFNFGLQYGVDSAGAGWVAAGQAQPASPDLAQEDVLIRNVEFNPNGEVCMDLFTSWGEVWHVEGDEQTLNGYWTPPNPEGVTGSCNARTAILSPGPVC